MSDEFNKEEFVKEFVKAAKKQDNEEMARLAQTTADNGLTYEERAMLMDEITAQLKDEEGDHEELIAALEKVATVARTSVENSNTVEEAKDADSQQSEVSDESEKAVDADSVTDKAEDTAESDGNALAEETEEGKTETTNS